MEYDEVEHAIRESAYAVIDRYHTRTLYRLSREQLIPIEKEYVSQMDKNMFIDKKTKLDAIDVYFSGLEHYIETHYKSRLKQ